MRGAPRNDNASSVPVNARTTLQARNLCPNFNLSKFLRELLLDASECSLGGIHVESSSRRNDRADARRLFRRIRAAAGAAATAAAAGRLRGPAALAAERA